MNKRTKSFIVTRGTDTSYNLIDLASLKAYEQRPKSNQLKEGQTQFGIDSVVYPLYNAEALTNLLEVNSTYASAVETISTDVAGVDFTFEPLEDVEPNPRYYQASKVFLNNLPTDINELLHPFHYDLESLGYAGLIVVREGDSNSKVVSLEHIPSKNLLVHQDDKRIKQTIDEKVKWFVKYGENYDDETGEWFDVNCNTGEIKKYGSLSPEERAEEILYMKTYTSKHSYYGMPPIIPAIRPIYGNIESLEYNLDFFENNGVPDMLVSITGDFEDPMEGLSPSDPEYDETQTIQYQITNQIQNIIEQKHSTMVLAIPSTGSEKSKVEINVEKLNTQQTDSGFQLFKEENTQEILTAIRIPEYLVNINKTGSLGGTNIDGATKLYYKNRVNPARRRTEKLINKFLQIEFKLSTFKFTITEPEDENKEDKLFRAEGLFNMGALTPNEVRWMFGAEFGIEADTNSPLLDSYYIHGTPVEQLHQGNMSNTNQVFDDLESALLMEAGEYDTISRNANKHVTEDSRLTRFSSSLKAKFKAIFNTGK